MSFFAASEHVNDKFPPMDISFDIRSKLLEGMSIIDKNVHAISARVEEQILVDNAAALEAKMESSNVENPPPKSWPTPPKDAGYQQELKDQLLELSKFNNSVQLSEVLIPEVKYTDFKTKQEEISAGEHGDYLDTQRIADNQSVVEKYEQKEKKCPTTIQPVNETVTVKEEAISEQLSLYKNALIIGALAIGAALIFTMYMRR